VISVPVGDESPTPVDAGAGAPGPGRPRRDAVARLLAVAGVVLTVAAATAGGTVWARGSADPAASPSPAARPEPARPPSRPATTPATRTAARPTAPARPLSVRIPAIGVSSTLVPLRLNQAGALQPPADFIHAGWYVGGPAPGEQGPAVIAGHVDSRAGPAIFFRLRELRPGDEVLVARADRSTARFRVVEVQRYPKNMFPAARVYQPTPDAALRLITCGGSFDYARRSYRDNIVVYAVGV
jgi:sortase (surface protein transpeptidase)